MSLSSVVWTSWINMHTSTRKLLTLLALTTSFVGLGTGLETLLPSQSAQAEGWVLFGPSRDTTLDYDLINERPNARSVTLRLFMPAQDVASTELQVNYPDAYIGLLRPELVRVYNRRSRQEIPLQEATNDAESGSLRFTFKDPVAAGVPLELRVVGLTNPSRPSIYRLQARLLGTEANPLFRYVGQWLVTIGVS
ncbi:DUF2808 domain-containing protein [Leptolyngbya sp. FACHB-261]|uniref:DUF2808 domain-containing protein n=1 Tax=Leptolyngbya sp. FACHB-261 TaxID=2692806 RepID=UPI00168693C1|nr:DUF2808 domain-containing protein [Leptolyngbya sp. FACHB-261]MBD2104655.1 DUF2808 domain-containing protein [Leptolyngbya sp. FACHB-261]